MLSANDSCAPTEQSGRQNSIARTACSLPKTLGMVPADSGFVKTKKKKKSQ
jgi:hypothetical protein